MHKKLCTWADVDPVSTDLYIFSHQHMRCKLFLFMIETVKGKVLPFSLPIVGPGTDPGVQAVSLQVHF